MYRFVFHIHTFNSFDGFIKHEVLASEARRLGLNALFITEHDNIEGVLRFKERFPEFFVVVCEEIYTRDGEIIGLFLKEEIPPGLPLSETIRAIRDQGGLAALPHPCDQRRTSTIRPDSLEEALSLVDIVEIFNGRSFSRNSDSEAEELCRRHGRVPIWGSDAHYPQEIGNAIIEAPRFTDAASFLQALRKAKPIHLRPTSILRRALIRLRRLWGCYSPLTIPERVFLRAQRLLIYLSGGGFLSLSTIDSWCEELAEKVRDSGYSPEAVIGIAGGGLYPAYKIAELLELPYGHMRISYPQLRLGAMDTDDVVGAIAIRNKLLGDKPRLIAGPNIEFAGVKVLLVDDDCTTGRSLRLALTALDKAGEVRIATLRELGASDPAPAYSIEKRINSRIRHERFPWIKYAPDYMRFARFKEQKL